jgi:hypothetical protein
MSIETKEKDLIRLQTLAAQYKRMAQDLKKMSAGKKEGAPFSLFSFLEDMATKGGLMDKIDYMRPGTLQLDSARTEKWVEIKLSDITLKELTIYLYNLQSLGENIYMKRLSARKEGDYLDLILQPAVVEVQ